LLSEMLGARMFGVQKYQLFMGMENGAVFQDIDIEERPDSKLSPEAGGGGASSAAAVSEPNLAGRAAAREPIEPLGELRKKIFNLALPSLTEMTLMTLVSMVDMMQVGRLGPWAITAVGLSNQPMFIAMSVFMSLNVGATAVVARSVGAKKTEDAYAAARQALVMASLFGVLLAVLGMVFAPSLLRMMGAQADVMEPGTAYLRIVAAGLVFQGAAVSLNASLRGAGDTKTPMSVNIVANLVNVVGNFLLINGHFGFPRLEVAGAAYATSFARLVALVLILRKVFGRKGAIKMSLHDSFRPDIEILKRIFRVGIPAAMEQVVMRSGQMVYARIVSSLGTVTYAAHQVALNIEGLSFTPPMSFQTASTTLVGQSLGARNPDRAVRAARESQKMALIGAGAAGFVLFFCGRYIAYAYTEDPVVISLTANVLRLIAFVQPFLASTFVLAGALRGAGDTRWTMYITMAGVWGVRVMTAYILVFKVGLGLYGAWIAMGLDMITRAILIDLRFRAGHWTKLKV
jgi:putative MATE family efflux protein